MAPGFLDPWLPPGMASDPYRVFQFFGTVHDVERADKRRVTRSIEVNREASQQEEGSL